MSRTALAWMLLLASGSARAGEVEVTDATSCLDSGLLGAELDLELGSGAMRIDVAVLVSGDQDLRTFDVRVYETGHEQLLWTRNLQIPEVDCPSVHRVVVRSIERGLAALPGWNWNARSRHADEWHVGVGGSVGWPRGMPAGELQAGIAVGLSERLVLPVGLRGRVTAFTPVGRGGAQIVSGVAYGGIAFDTGWLRPHLLLEGGVGQVRGRSFEENRSEFVPRSRVRLGSAVALLAWLSLVPELEIPLHRVTSFGAESGLTTMGEPFLRGGLSWVIQSTNP